MLVFFFFHNSSSMLVTLLETFQGIRSRLQNSVPLLLTRPASFDPSKGWQMAVPGAFMPLRKYGLWGFKTEGFFGVVF